MEWSSALVNEERPQGLRTEFCLQQSRKDGIVDFGMLDQYCFIPLFQN